MGDTGAPSGEPGRRPGAAPPGAPPGAAPPGAAPPGAAPPRRRRQGLRRGTPGGAGRDACPGLDALYGTHYRSLFRLAALLTGDTHSAEAVVQDSFAAMHRHRKPPDGRGGLAALQRMVVARARRSVRYRRPAGGRQSGGRQSGGPGPAAVAGEAPNAPREPGPDPDRVPPFEDSAVVRALRGLPAGQREAVVLTLYLHLTDEQAAAAMQVSHTALHRELAAGRSALRSALPGS